MPSTRHVLRDQPYPASPKPQSQFTFPANKHLLITTASHILAWDSAGVHTIFTSSKNGIVAAKEAKDGSGFLAIADKRIVVLHDTKRGQERSWGLEADGGEVRHLDYTTDAKSLFSSTSLNTDIQRYSTERSRLLSPASAHASPPSALAVSPTGHLLVSASDNPPVIYLKDLRHNSAPTLIESRASTAAVSTIAFHPERPNIFLLAFQDGTLAAFDATKVSRRNEGTFSNQERVNAGEISHLAKLHRTTSELTIFRSTAAAAFLPGYKTRAISGGSDGRCRLIDFADGGVILRTWHAQAPVTSLSVLSQKPETSTRKQSAGNRASHTMGGPTSTNNLIAVGRVDGIVHLYDSVGLLLSRQALSESGEKIISVEWGRGPSPKPIADTIIAKDPLELDTVPPAKTLPVKTAETAKPQVAADPSAQTRRATNFEHVGLPPELRRPKEVLDLPTARTNRRFTIHPDEVEDGTVRHTPFSHDIKPGLVSKGEYLDLFSPMKAPEANADQSTAKRIASPPRSRPRISTQTFVKSPQPTPTAQASAVATPRNLALFPSTDSGSESAHQATGKAEASIRQRTPHKNSPLVHCKRLTFKPTAQRRSRTSGTFRPSRPTPNKNAKVLADLRKLSTIHPAHRDGGVLSGFGVSKPSQSKRGPSPTSKGSALDMFHRPVDHVETGLDSENALKAYEHAHTKSNWPEDSNQDSSLDGDIWLTSDSDDQSTRRHNRRHQPIERPPARQTSRSRMDSKGTMSTMAQQPAALSVKPTTNRNTIDGSTDEDMHTAGTHISPTGTFSPSSNDVRDLFPRSSSLSPSKKSKHQRPMQGKVLRELTLNTIQAKSPWTRVKAGRDAHAITKSSIRRHTNGQVRIHEDYAVGGSDANAPGAESHCNMCLPTRAKVIALEGEVAQLQGEVLALKAALRRNGIPLSMAMTQFR